jgi:hypothetical protein
MNAKGERSMTHSAIRRSVWALLVAASLVACTAGPEVSTGVSDAPTSVVTESATPSPTVVPTASATASPTATAASSAPSATAPPAANLSVEGGDPVTGQLGSFTWIGGGSDSPWLPGSPIAVGGGERLTVVLAGGVAVADWSARRVKAGTTDGSGAVGLGHGGPPMTFGAPPAGRWSVQVTVGFAGGIGSATYYWEIAVR